MSSSTGNDLLQCVWRYIAYPSGRTSKEYADDIAEELSFHLDQRATELERAGLEPSEAAKVAMEKFGDVSRLASECHSIGMNRFNWVHRTHIIATGSLAVAVVFLFVLRTTPPIPLSAQLPPSLSQLLDNDWSGDVFGRVLNEDGSPIIDAHVLVSVKTWPDGSFFQRPYFASTLADGSFRLTRVRPTNEHSEVQITALAPHRALHSIYHSFEAGESEPFEFRLREAAEVKLVVKNEAGEPMPGVRVMPRQRTETSGESHLVYFESSKRLVGTTDRSGQVDMPYFQSGDSVSVWIQNHDDWHTAETDVPALGRTVPVFLPVSPKPSSKE